MQASHSCIALLHHTGGGNLGDEAVLEAVIQNILKRRPDAELTAVTMNPPDTAERYRIPVLPIRTYTWGKKRASGGGGQPHAKRGLGTWLGSTRNPAIRILRTLLRRVMFPIRIFTALRNNDQLVISGGGQFTGRSGPWGFPFAIFLWTSLARLAGVRRVVLNVGVGPLNSRRVNFFTIRSLQAANYISFRDEESQALARKAGFRGDTRVVADNAYLLEIPESIKAGPARANPIVGIAPMPYPLFDPQEVASGHQQLYRECIAKFAGLAISLIESSCPVDFFAIDVGTDTKAVEEAGAKVRERYPLQLLPYRPDGTLAELLARIAELDYVVTCRLHGVVLAHLLNKPVLALAHHPKVQNLMDDLGLSEYCFDLATFDMVRVRGAFDAMVRNSAEIKQRMKASLIAYRGRLEAQFDEIFPPAQRRAKGAG